MAKRCASARVKRRGAWAKQGMVRAITKLKNRIEGIPVGRSLTVAARFGFMLLSLLPAIDEHVRRRYQENRKGDRDTQSSQDGACEWRVGLATGAQFESHGEQADDGRERSHQHGAQPDAAGGGHGVSNAHPFVA